MYMYTRFFTAGLLRTLLFANGHCDALEGDNSMWISPKCFDLQFFTHVISINILKNQFSLDYTLRNIDLVLFLHFAQKTKSQRSKVTCHKLYHNTEIGTKVFTLLI